MEGEVLFAAAVVYQTPLFSAQMIKASGFDVATVLETAAGMCRAQDNQPTALVRTGAHAEVDSETESTLGASLCAAAARIQTIPRRPAIERASLTPSVVMIDNSRGSQQIIGITGQVFTPQRVLLDFRAQPLMLDKTAVQQLGLQQGTLEPCPFTINTSMGGQ